MSTASQRAYRAAHPEYTAANRKRTKARRIALGKLAHRHPADFRRIYAAELAALGVELRPPGRPRKAPQ